MPRMIGHMEVYDSKEDAIRAAVPYSKRTGDTVFVIRTASGYTVQWRGNVPYRHSYTEVAPDGNITERRI